MKNSVHRIEGLVNGSLRPEDEYEDVFMVGVVEALSANLILSKYIEIFDDIDGEILLLHSFIMGYAMGQQKLEQELADFNSEDGNKSNH